eukprot:410039-Rhodomonas_salina.1
MVSSLGLRSASADTISESDIAACVCRAFSGRGVGEGVQDAATEPLWRDRVSALQSRTVSVSLWRDVACPCRVRVVSCRVVSCLFVSVPVRVVTARLRGCSTQHATRSPAHAMSALAPERASALAKKLWCDPLFFHRFMKEGSAWELEQQRAAALESRQEPHCKVWSDTGVRVCAGADIVECGLQRRNGVSLLTSSTTTRRMGRTRRSGDEGERRRRRRRGGRRKPRETRRPRNGKAESARRRREGRLRRKRRARRARRRGKRRR